MAAALFIAGPEGSIMLTIENLYFSCTGSAPWLLENVDIHLAGGEYISIVGNNGSGKSTLLKIIHWAS